MPVENQGIRHDPRDMARDEMALMVEQSAVREMRAALAEAGLLDDEYHERLKHRWEVANDAVDRAVLAFCDRREPSIERYLAIAAQIACEYPWGFTKALYRQMAGRAE